METKSSNTFKSLTENPHYIVWTFRKPHSNNTASVCYHEIGFARDEGPYKDHNKYSVDVTYYFHPDIYTQSLETILKEHVQVDIHEFIVYNMNQWDIDFRKWFKSRCHRMPYLNRMGQVVFNNGKYIIITWKPPIDGCYAYPGYEGDIAMFGGKAIDYNLEHYDDTHSLKYLNDKIWYLSLDDNINVVADSGLSVWTILRRIHSHRMKFISYQTLDTKLKAIPGKLNKKKCGKPLHFAETFPIFIWDQLLTDLLNNKIKIERKGYSRDWTVDLKTANSIFTFNGATYFSRSYIAYIDETEDEESSNDNDDKLQSEILVYVDPLKMKFSVKTGRFYIDGRILMDVDGVTYGQEALDDSDADVLSWISMELISIVCEYLTKSDLFAFRSVAKRYCSCHVFP